MDRLKISFENAKGNMEQLLGKLGQGQLLEEPEIQECVRLLDALRKDQRRCVRKFVREADCTAEDVPRGLEELEKAFEQMRRDKQLTYAKGIVDAFDAIQCTDDNFEAELKPFKQELCGMEDAALLENMGSGEFTPYVEFLSLLDVREPSKVESLAGKFGFQLIFGIVAGKFSLPDSIDIPTPVSDTIDDSTEEDIEDEVQEVESTSKTTKAKSGKTKKSSKKFSAEAEPEILEPVTEAEALRTDTAIYGELVKESSGKKPGGSSSLLSAYRKKFHGPLAFTAKYLMGFSGITKQVITERGDKSKNPPAVIGNVINYLYKEGFIDKYSMGEDTEPYYRLSAVGREIFKSESVQKQLLGRKFPEMSTDFSTVSRFVRYREVFEYEVYAISDITHCKVIMNAFGGFTFLGILNRLNGETELLFIPSLYTMEDQPEDLCVFLNRLGKYFPAFTEDPCIFIAAPDGQAEAWVSIYRKFLKLPEGTRFYFSVIGEKEFRDEDGEFLKLDEILSDSEAFINFMGNEDTDKDLEDYDVDTDAAPEYEAVASPKPNVMGQKANRPKSNAEPRRKEARLKKLQDAEPEQEDSEAAILAQKLLVQPEPPLPDSGLEDIITLLLREDRAMEAVLLAKTVADSSHVVEANQLYEALLYASNLPLGPRNYTGSSMGPEGSSPLIPYCRAAFMFWSLCFPSNAYDQPLYNRYKGSETLGLDDKVSISEEYLSYIRSAAMLLEDELCKTSFEYDGAGFSQRVLNSFLSSDKLEMKQRSLKKEAGSHCPAPRINTMITGLEQFLKCTMGPASDIGRCIGSIASGKGRDVREVFNEFSDDGATISNEKIDWYIDAKWNELRNGNSSIKVKQLAYKVRAKLENEFTIRLKIMSEWLEWDAAGQGGKCAENYQPIVSRLKKLLSDAIVCAEGLIDDSIPAPDAAGLSLLNRVFRRICSILGNESELNPAPVKCFSPLLMAGYIVLDEDGLPVIDKSMNELSGMEPWRMVLQHIAAKKYSEHEALRRIELPDVDPSRFEDYSSAKVLYEMLGIQMDVDSYQRKIQAAHAAGRSGEEKFRGDVLMACAYGQIAEHTKETLFAQLERFKPLFVGELSEDPVYSENMELCNYAHFHMLLGALTKQLEKEKETRTELFLNEYESRTGKLHGDPPPVLEQVHKEIMAGNLATAEDYLSRYDAGETELTKNTQGPEQNFHDQFLQNADWFIKQCEREEHKGRSLKQWGSQVLKSHNFWSAGNEKNSAMLLEYWIVGRDDKNTPALIKKFLSWLEFDVHDVGRNDSITPAPQYEVFTADISPVPMGLADYRHPVKKFGTGLGPTLSIACLYGCKGASTLIDIMTHKLQLTGTTLVLMDGVLSMLERRRVAARFKSLTSGQNSFLLIDRALLLYLAALDRGSQQTAMLQCTLPYTYEQLYTEGTGPVADEMFIGRVSDLKAIGDPDGTCLVYGGRQLGKTALLRRVASIHNRPGFQQYAVYIDIKEKSMNGLVSELNRHLSTIAPNGVPLLEKEYGSLEEICGALAARVRDFRQLTILLDEADCFFDEIAEQHYEPVHPIVLLRNDTKNKVKFVFAGTHNIASTTQAIEGNSDIIQLGRPLCIAPLSAADATRLIKWPLSYLGFRIGDQQISLILTNTNYYPGLIHLFCNTLTKSVCENYSTYYSERNDNPPYPLSDEQLKAVFQKTDIKQEIARRVTSTIKLDRKYGIVANLMAFMQYEDQQSDSERLYGYTPDELLDCAEREFGIPDFSRERLSVENLGVLMDEMEKMGILWKRPDSESYRFRQRDFLSYIGSADKVLSALLDEGKGGEG